MFRATAIDVPAGELPAFVQTPDEPAAAPALLVVPSIFGPAEDLLDRLGALDDTVIVVPDPFWRTGEGAVPYDDADTAIGRLADFDVEACATEMAAAAAWAREHGNGGVVAVGICFGGPFVVELAARGLVQGIVTWHGSRLDSVLDRVPSITCPVRHHVGGADPVVPPEVLAAIRDAFADHDDCEIVVHDGAAHGFSHDGDAWDPVAFRASMASVVALLDRLR